MEIRDAEIVIVGAGPIGIEMGVSLQRLGLDFCMIDAGQVGHTIGWYAPGTHFFSSPERIAIAGIPLLTRDQGKATREEYLDYLMTVVWQHDLPLHTLTRLLSVEPLTDTAESQSAPGSNFIDSNNRKAGKVQAGDRDDQAHGADLSRPRRQNGPQSRTTGWRLNIQRGGQKRTIECRFLVLAIGDMHGPRKLGIPGEEQSNVSHYLRELRNYFRQEVVIVGGRNSAVEAAIRIFRMGGKVTLLYRGKELDGKTIKYWLYPEIQSMIKNGLIRFIPEAAVQEIRGNRLYYSSAGRSWSVRGSKEVADPGNGLSGSGDSGGSAESYGAAAKSEPDEAVAPLNKAAEVKAAQDVQEVQADQFLLLTGYEQDCSFLESLGLQLEGPEKKPVFDESTMETNLSNVFIAGTATAGSQERHSVFIENSHEHVERIGRTILGRRHGSGAPAQAASSVAEGPSSLDPGHSIEGKRSGGKDRSQGDALKRIYQEHPES